MQLYGKAIIKNQFIKPHFLSEARLHNPVPMMLIHTRADLCTPATEQADCSEWRHPHMEKQREDLKILLPRPQPVDSSVSSSS